MKRKFNRITAFVSALTMCFGLIAYMPKEVFAEDVQPIDTTITSADPDLANSETVESGDGDTEVNSTESNTTGSDEIDTNTSNPNSTSNNENGVLPISEIPDEIVVLDAGSTPLSEVTIIDTGSSDLMSIDIESITYKYNTYYKELTMTTNIRVNWKNGVQDFNYLAQGYDSWSDDGVHFESSNHNAFSEIANGVANLLSRDFYETGSYVHNYYCIEIGYVLGYDENGNPVDFQSREDSFVSLKKYIIPFSEISKHFSTDEQSEFIGEVTSNIGTYDLIKGDIKNLSFSEPKVYEPYPTSFEDFNLKSSDENVVSIIENKTDSSKHIFADVVAHDTGTANIICTFHNATVSGKKLKSYTLIYEINVADKISLNVWSDTLGKREISIDYNYPDNLFAGKSTDYNYELSKLSSIMAMSAYWNSNHTNEYAVSNLKKLGFDNIDDCGSYAKLDNMTENDCHYVGYTFATKDIYVGDKKKTIIAVVIKGTSGNEEWYSNFDVRNNTISDYFRSDQLEDVHYGFKEAENKMNTDFWMYILENKLNSNYDDKILWVTAHSRGSAIGNIFAGEITEAEIFPKENIYAYLYATPAVMVTSTATESIDIESDYSNIYNFINPQDFVPRMPLQKWGYGRYGKNLVFPNEVTNGTDEYKTYETELDNKFNEIFGVSIKQYLFKNGTQKTIKLCNHLYDNCSETKFYYIQRVGNPLVPVTLFNYFHNGIAAAAGPDKLSGGIYLLSHEDQPFTSITSYFINNEIKMTDITSGQLLDKIMDEYVKYSHTPEMYIAWAYVCDEYSKDEKYSDFKNTLYKKGIVACPVDIEIYNNQNNLVGRVVNNQVDESVTTIGILVDEETSTKTIYMPVTEQFTIKAIGYDEGTMDYSIELCDITDFSTFDLRSVTDIEITPNTIVTTNTDLSNAVVLTAVTIEDGCDKVIEYTIDQNNNVEEEETQQHSFSDEWKNDDENHWHECSCGEKADIAEHEFDDGIITIQPTETSKGEKTYRCKICGYVKTEVISETVNQTPSTPSNSSKPSSPSTPSTGSDLNVAPANVSTQKIISVKVENKITGKSSKAIGTRKNNEVSVKLGTENNGLYANVITDNDDFIEAVLIEKGKAKFDIPDDVNFRIVIDEFSYVEDVSSGSAVYEENSKVKNGSYVMVIIIVSLFGVGFVAYRKRSYTRK